jgi:hypothetical protein
VFTTAKVTTLAADAYGDEPLDGNRRLRFIDRKVADLACERLRYRRFGSRAGRKTGEHTELRVDLVETQVIGIGIVTACTPFVERIPLGNKGVITQGPVLEILGPGILRRLEVALRKPASALDGIGKLETRFVCVERIVRRLWTVCLDRDVVLLIAPADRARHSEPPNALLVAKVFHDKVAVVPAKPGAAIAV